MHTVVYLCCCTVAWFVCAESAFASWPVTFKDVTIEGYNTQARTGDGKLKHNLEIFKTTIASSSNLAYYLQEAPHHDGVKIYNQNIPVLYDNSFTGTKLVEVKLNYCNLRVIESRAFRHSKIDNLDLRYNILEEIRGGTFSGASNTVDLSKNRIRSIESCAFQNASIFWLILSDNNLQEITAQVFCVTSIRWLILSNNSISRIAQEAIKNIKDLTDINVENNQIEDINDVFTNLPEIVEISINNNKITKLEPGVFRSTFVSKTGVVYFKKNEIKLIRRGVFNGLTLDVVDLSYNQIVHIEKGAFDNMPKLTYLLLTNNRIKEIKMGVFSNINVSGSLEVTLEGNEIDYIEPESFKNSVLHSLILTRNSLTEVKEKTFMNVSMQLLDLSWNKIHTFELGSFKDTIIFQGLDLSNNNLSEFSRAILSSIYLDNNYIRKIIIDG